MTIQPGDRVVLNATPRLSKAEMIAIWEVRKIEGQWATLYADGIGRRSFRTNLLRLYPKAEPKENREQDGK